MQLELSPVPSVIPSTHSTPQWYPTALGWPVPPPGNSCSAPYLSWPRWLGSTAYPFLKNDSTLNLCHDIFFSKPAGIWCHGVKALSKSQSQPELTVYYLYTNEKYQLLLQFFFFYPFVSHLAVFWQKQETRVTARSDYRVSQNAKENNKHTDSKPF